MTSPRRFAAAAVIIDLDGTLLDTAPDLVAAANAMRVDLGMAPIASARIMAYVGKGMDRMVHRTLVDDLDGQADPELFERGRSSFSGHYQRFNGQQAVPYPGVVEGLRLMRERGLRLACVTNKPQRFADPLLRATGLQPFFEITLGGDALATRKPDPAPMLHVAGHFGLPARAIVAIGDSVNDALAARAAGMAVMAVPYGYNEGRDVHSLDVDAIVPSLLAGAQLIDVDRPPRTSANE